MTDWRDGFKVALIGAMLRLGEPVKKDPSFHRGWIEYYVGSDGRDARLVRRAEAERAGIDYPASHVAESEWAQFEGTFYEGDTRHVGIDAHLVLMDGTRQHWRYEGNLGDLIVQVVSA